MTFGHIIADKLYVDKRPTLCRVNHIASLSATLTTDWRPDTMNIHIL